MNSARFDYILRQVLIVPIFAMLVGAAAVYWEIHDANLTVAEIQVSDESINQTLVVERLIVDQETGLRGYQTTGDEAFLGPYRDAENQIDAAFDSLRDGSDADEAPLVDEVETLHSAWEQGFAVPLIATIRAGGKTNSVELNLQGRVQIDAMRHKLAQLTTAGKQDREAHIRHYQRQVTGLALALIVFAVILGLVIGLYTRTLVHDLSEAFKRSSNILRVRADEAFRSEQHLRTTLASIGDGVITCTLDGLVQTLNQAAEQLTGWSDEEARGAPLARIFAVFDSRTHQPMEDLITRSKAADHAVKLGEHAVLLRKDGSEIEVDDSLAPIRDKHAAIIGFVLVFRDVTLARKSQVALIANEKLAVAGRLAATIAHEIHNPLDSISNLLFLMDGQSTPEETAHFLALARQEIARVTQISRSMLSLYRESRAPIAIDLKDMLESILMLMERRFSSLGITIETNLPPDLLIHGFPGELRQVFTNLLANAAEASDPGGIVQLAAVPEKNRLSADGLRHEDGACITITDTGAGVPEDVLHKLFQPFFSTKGEQGTGLGLWVSRGIIVKHGGAIHFTSSIHPEDHGTTVSVFLAANPTINAGGD